MIGERCSIHAAGAAIYTAANICLSKKGAKHRKHSCDQEPSEKEQSGSGVAIAIGALPDGIPESIVIAGELASPGRREN